MSVGTGSSLTPERRIPRKKNNMKSLAMFPPGNYPIPNQYINRLSTEKDQSLPPQLSKYCPRYKSLINEAEDDRNDSTDISRNNKEYFVNNLKAINNKDIDDEYKDENSKDHNSNESFINKNKNKEAWIERLVSMDF